jgi:hypothetical protein
MIHDDLSLTVAGHRPRIWQHIANLNGYLAISKHVSNVRIYQPYSIHVPLTLPSSVTDLYFLAIHWQYISSFCNNSTRTWTCFLFIRFTFNTRIPYKILQNITSCVCIFMIHIKSNTEPVSCIYILHCYFFIPFSSSPLKVFCVYFVTLVTLNSFAFETGMFLFL